MNKNNPYQLVILITLLLTCCNLSQNDSINENGDIISIKKNNNEIQTIRKHVQSITIGDLATNQNLIIYSSPNFNRKLFYLQYGDTIIVKQILTRQSLTNGFKDIWYKIRYLSKEGWLYVGNTNDINNRDPYANDNWKLIEVIDNKWKIRKINENISVWGKVEIRNKPGISNSKVLFIIDPNGVVENYQQTVSVIAMTEETEIIENIEDHWLKIEYDSHSGWIFGGYASAEGGGSKYLTPSNLADSNIGIY